MDPHLQLPCAQLEMLVVFGMIDWHANNNVVNKIAKICNGMIDYNNLFCCQTCTMKKMHKLPYNKIEFYCDKPLAILHLDVWGPAPVTSITGFKYYLIVEEFSTCTLVYPLKNKSDVLKEFKKFQTMVENLLDHRSKIIQPDSRKRDSTEVFPSIPSIYPRTNGYCRENTSI